MVLRSVCIESLGSRSGIIAVCGATLKETGSRSPGRGQRLDYICVGIADEAAVIDQIPSPCRSSSNSNRRHELRPGFVAKWRDGLTIRLLRNH